MFDLLKEKLSSFTEKLKKKAEEKTVKQEKAKSTQASERTKSDFILPDSKPVSELKVSSETKPALKPASLSTPAQEQEKTSLLSQYIKGVKKSLEGEKQLKRPQADSRIADIQRDIELEKHAFKEKALQKTPSKPAQLPEEKKHPTGEPRVSSATLKHKEGTSIKQAESEAIKEQPAGTVAKAIKEKPVKPAALKSTSLPEGEETPVTGTEPTAEEEFKLKPMSELMEEVESEEQPFSSSLLVAKPEEGKPVEGAISNEPPPVKAEAREQSAAAVEKRELKARVGAIRSIKGVLRGYTELREGDIADLLFELELALLESDVNHETATAFVSRVKELLLKEKIPRGTQLNEFLKQKIRQVLVELTKTRQVNIFEMADSVKPFKILFLGPNGAGKTTTIAKLTYAFQQMGKKVIWAAADTFRAASIEQLEAHAKKLNVRVVKHDYGADPTAVAFDALKAAEAEKADVLMIDSAGRQETNRNLLEELKKMERVIKPDLKVFVGEAFAGKNLIKQARTFDEALNLDGFILSKIDTDAKGGTVLSLLYELKKPVLFIGTGQEYTDLIKFTPEFIIDRIV